MSEVKRCPRCEMVKTLGEFPRNRGRGDGLGCYCSECMRSISREFYAVHKDYYLEDQRVRRATHPIVAKARHSVSYAIQCGRLVRPSACEECGKVGKVEAHHADYAKPFDVTWVCRSCHATHHWNERLASKEA